MVWFMLAQLFSALIDLLRIARLSADE